jgi:hypothetical protein
MALERISDFQVTHLISPFKMPFCKIHLVSVVLLEIALLRLCEVVYLR